jgi:hypothetical protein
MKKILTISMSVLMGLAAASCSNDDLIDDDIQSNQKEQSYINVNIYDVGVTLTRATASDGFAYGSAEERKVTDAKFFFFDSNDHLLTESELWGDGTQMKDSANSASPAGTVEAFGEAIVPLHDVNPGNKPTKMVTVLNPPADLTTVSSLEDLMAKLAPDCRTSANTFTMTNSSYKQEGKTDYCVTELAENNFFATEEKARAASDANRINVYVERLAAKVEVTVDASNTQVWTKGDDDGIYKLGDFTITGLGEDGKTYPVYVKFLNWGLNATTQKSYLMKHIDTSWASVYPSSDHGFTWNDAANFRSYWCKSYNYGLSSANYPDHYISGDVCELKYISANQITGTLGLNNGSSTTNSSYLYCNENTNTPDILAKAYQSTATCVLVKARLTNKDGSNIYDGKLVKYNGKLYTDQGYAKFVFNSLKNSGKLNYAIGETAIADSDVELGSGSYLNGRVVVKLTEAAAAKTGWVDNNNSGAAVTAQAINETLAAFNNSNNDAIGFYQGLMYYNVPIEHLNNTDNVTDDNGNLTVHEGRYGVVRNHWYKLTITGISENSIGHGIDIPDEPIVPNPDVEEDYYLGANINILAWKTITQSVQLKR